MNPTARKAIIVFGASVLALVTWFVIELTFEVVPLGAVGPGATPDAVESLATPSVWVSVASYAVVLALLVAFADDPFSFWWGAFRGLVASLIIPFAAFVPIGVSMIGVPESHHPTWVFAALGAIGVLWLWLVIATPLWSALYVGGLSLALRPRAPRQRRSPQAPDANSLPNGPNDHHLIDVSPAFGIRLTFTTTEAGGRQSPLSGGSPPTMKWQYRPNWGLPGWPDGELTAGPVLGFSKSDIYPGDTTEAVIVGLFADHHPQWWDVTPGDVLRMYEGSRICGIATVLWVDQFTPGDAGTQRLLGRMGA